MSTDQEKRALLLVTYVHTASGSTAHVEVRGSVVAITGNRLEIAVTRSDLIEPEDLDGMGDAAIAKEVKWWLS